MPAKYFQLITQRDSKVRFDLTGIYSPTNHVAGHGLVAGEGSALYVIMLQRINDHGCRCYLNLLTPGEVLRAGVSPGGELGLLGAVPDSFKTPTPGVATSDPGSEGSSTPRFGDLGVPDSAGLVIGTRQDLKGQEGDILQFGKEISAEIPDDASKIKVEPEPGLVPGVRGFDRVSLRDLPHLVSFALRSVLLATAFPDEEETDADPSANMVRGRILSIHAVQDERGKPALSVTVRQEDGTRMILLHGPRAEELRRGRDYIIVYDDRGKTLSVEPLGGKEALVQKSVQ